MDQHFKAELIKSYRKRYERACKKEKTQIITQISDVTGYCRAHIIRALGKNLQVRKKITRPRASRYGHLYETLKRIWAASNFLCGKRLKPFLPELVKSLKQHKEIKLSKADEALILSVSAATPAQRLIARKDTPKEVKKRLRDTFRKLNPVALLRDINDLVSELYATLLE